MFKFQKTFIRRFFYFFLLLGNLGYLSVNHIPFIFETFKFEILC